MYEKEVKILIYTGLAALGVLGIVKIVKAIGTKRSENVQKKANNVISSNMTISMEQATAIANSLWYAMKDTGTDEDIIRMKLAVLKTPDDWKAVNVAFGLRPYSYYGAPVIGSGENIDLLQWFKKELSSSFYKEVSDKFAQYGLLGI